MDGWSSPSPRRTGRGAGYRCRQRRWPGYGPIERIRRGDRLVAGQRWKDHGLVFASTVGTPLNPRNVNRAWYQVRAKGGLGWLRLHDLRHACATFLLASGASPRTVMKTLGHSQIALTMNTYAHVLEEVERTAMDDAARRLFG